MLKSIIILLDKKILIKLFQLIDLFISKFISHHFQCLSGIFKNHIQDRNHDFAIQNVLYILALLIFHNLYHYHTIIS